MYRIYRDPLEDGKDNSESDAHVCVGVFFRFAQSWNPESTSTKKQRKGGYGGAPNPSLDLAPSSLPLSFLCPTEGRAPLSSFEILFAHFLLGV